MIVQNTSLDHRTIRSIVFGILLAMFLGALDQTIVATALPTIGRAFSDVENLSWVVTSYLLTATAVTPLYGKLSDIYGRRRMMLIGIGIFVVGSIACAAANSMTTLILARGLQGVGAGGLLPLAQTIIGDVVAPRDRGRYQGYVGVIFALAMIGGPVLGGLLTEHLHWSLIFWINVPLGALAYLLTNNLLKRLPRHERPHKLDIVGATLMMTATLSLLLALTWGGTRYAWASPTILGLVAASVMLWLLFALQLARAPEPFLPISILRNAVVRMGTAAASSAMGTMIGLTILVPLYFETVLRLSAGQSGLALIPLMAATTVTSTLTGQAMGRFTHYKRVPIVGMLTSIAALGVLAWAPGGMSVTVVAGLLFLVGAGLGTVFPVTTVSVQNAVSHQELGTATAAMNFFRSLASAVLVAAFGAIVIGGIGLGGGAPLETLLGEASRLGIALPGVFRWVFVAAAGVLGAGLICLIAMEERPLRAHVHMPMTPPSAIPAE